MKSQKNTSSNKKKSRKNTSSNKEKELSIFDPFIFLWKSFELDLKTLANIPETIEAHIRLHIRVNQLKRDCSAEYARVRRFLKYQKCCEQIDLDLPLYKYTKQCKLLAEHFKIDPS